MCSYRGSVSTAAGKLRAPISSLGSRSTVRGGPCTSPRFPGCAYNYFAATFSGAFTACYWGSLMIQNPGCHVPMTNHEYEAGKTYKVNERVYFQGWVFANIKESTGTAPTVTAGVPETNPTWEWVSSVPMVNSHFGGANSYGDGRGFVSGTFPAQLPIGGQLVPTALVRFQSASTEWCGVYMTPCPQMGLYVTGDCDRSVIDWQIDGEVIGINPAAYSEAAAYALYALVKYEGRNFSCLVANSKGVAPPKAAENNANWAYLPQVTGTSGSAVYITALTGEGNLRFAGAVHNAAQEPFSSFDAAIVVNDSSNVDLAPRSILGTGAGADDIKISTTASTSDSVIVRKMTLGSTSKPLQVRIQEAGGHAITNTLVEGLRPGATPIVTAGKTQRERLIGGNEALTPNAAIPNVFVYVLTAALTTQIAPTLSSFTNGQTYTLVFEQDEVGGHAYAAAWPAKIKWLNQPEPWDGTPRSRVAVTFTYKSSTEELEETSRSISTGQKKFLPMKPKAGEYKIPFCTETTTTAAAVGDKNAMRLQRYEGVGQTFTKIALNTTVARKKGVGFVAQVAAYADDGTGARPELATPLAVLGTIAINEKAELQ